MVVERDAGPCDGLAVLLTRPLKVSQTAQNRVSGQLEGLCSPSVSRPPDMKCVCMCVCV